MNSAAFRYEEHFTTRVHGIDVTDASVPNALETAHRELIWVGTDSEGEWLTREQAVQLAAAITTATDNQARRMAARAAANTNDGAAS